jgi:segregation and condensation protein A
MVAPEPNPESAGADLDGGDYTVLVDRVFSGPLDLLLHLVREQEVEIHEVQIGPILKGFLAHLDSLEQIDIEQAGEFVLMAATLMAIKARSLLPREEVDLSEELDPRDELIQRLVEYRRFRQASERLESLAFERERLFPRGMREEDPNEPEEITLDLGELTAWDLLGTWSRLVRETLANRPHRVAGEARPIRFYVDRLVERLRGMGPVRLFEMVPKGSDEPQRREELIGSFVAILELAKLGLIRVHQDALAADVAVELALEPGADLEEVLGRAQLEQFDAAIDAQQVEEAESQLEAWGAAGQAAPDDSPGEDRAETAGP